MALRWLPGEIALGTGSGSQEGVGSSLISFPLWRNDCVPGFSAGSVASRLGCNKCSSGSREHSRDQCLFHWKKMVHGAEVRDAFCCRQLKA